MEERSRAWVVPKALGPLIGEPLPLEDLLAPYVEAGETGLIAILGPPGSGKTTALAHLASRWPDLPIFDEPLLDAPQASPASLVIYSATSAIQVRHRARLTLAPWTDDDLLEYCMAWPKEQCASVLRRVRAAPDRQIAKGSPEIWSTVLDAFAEDGSLLDLGSAICRVFGTDSELAGKITLFSTPLDTVLSRAKKLVEENRLETQRRKLLRSRSVQLVLGARQMRNRLARGRYTSFLDHRFTADIVRAAGREIAKDPAALERLVEEATRAERQATAASLLLAAGAAWTPPPRAHLSNALLTAASWPGVDLTGSDLTGADLGRANLSGASLVDARAARAHFRRADLTAARASGADLAAADLRGADLTGADLPDVDLTGARLRNARLARANLLRAKLARARLEGADLTGACLDDAEMEELMLEQTALSGATLRRTNLRRTHLAGAFLPGAEAPEARLAEADLTDAHLPDARLRAVDLHGAGLAGVCLERADLRDADLTAVRFHLGSSRSGLVDSPIASEGTRTGFYTDDYEALHFEQPEKIRKANLCGADLRGARIDKTDFYLVDLRGAHYDRAQEEHFRRCGAILARRV